MQGIRRILALLAAGTLLACGPVDRGPALGSDLERDLDRGRSFAEALVARGRGEDPVLAATVVGLGYLERLRLGLGSPFRLMEQAGHDPRLEEGTRVRLAWALLARTLDGDAYHLDPAALDRADLRPRPGSGRRHLALIEGAVSEARDPRGGELAVRLAYALAAAERSVGRKAPSLAAQSAALLRDRELAREDALRLLRAARAEGRDPLALLARWRAERRFLVESPSVTPLPLETEREAMELAPRLAAAVRGMEEGRETTASPVGRRRPVPLLGRAAALRLSELADSLGAPPQTPLVVAMNVYRRDILEQTWAPAHIRAARLRFVERADREETLAAEYALLTAAGAGGPAPASAVLWGATALRGLNQEAVWFPGFGGPSARELEVRFGLAAVSFDDAVPAAWRPYYRRMLATALSDLQRVLPSLDLRGLQVHFGSGRGKRRTLALHDPGDRTVYLPPATAAGTIAHEVAHDLDWQEAHRRYRVRGDYATDRAASRRRDRLGTLVRELASHTARRGDVTDASVHDRRPAEIFARALDWFVVVSLAREGRTNGYLSSVQDDVLTGYGTVRPPDISGRAGAALVALLDEMAPVYPATRSWFLNGYGLARALTPYDLVRRILEAPVPEPALAGEARGGLDGRAAVSAVDSTGPAGPTAPPPAAGTVLRFPAVERARDGALAAIDAWVCRAPGAAYAPRLEAARRRLVAHAAAARARGIALDYAGEIAGPEGRERLARTLYGVPWRPAPPDTADRELVRELAAAVQALEAGPAAAAAGFHLAAAPAHCGVGLGAGR